MKILAFGEILWDIFISDNETEANRKIGGAPFNFAAHCAKNGAEAFLVSAVGKDKNGYDALEEARRLGIKTDYIATLPQYETGYCKVTLNNGMPNYDLVSNVAYDHIPKPNLQPEFDAVYMGTLAMRKSDSKSSFDKIIAEAKANEVLLDVNLRGDFYSKALVEELLSHTTVLKVSREEIPLFGEGEPKEICKGIAHRFPKLKYICVTLGKDGAFVLDCKGQVFYNSEKPKSKAISTVGAGDSFAAAFLVSLLSGYPPEISLRRAVALSDFVVTELGAVPNYDINEVFKGI